MTMQIVNHALTTAVTTVVANGRGRTNYLRMSVTGAGDVTVGNKLSSGALVDFITIATGETKLIETDAMRTSSFYAQSASTSTFTVTNGGDIESTSDKDNEFKMITKTVEFAPADKAAMLVFNSIRQGYSYLEIKNTDATNSIAFSFEATGTTLGGNITLAAAGGTIKFDTASLGNVALYAKANVADCDVEFIYG